MRTVKVSSWKPREGRRRPTAGRLPRLVAPGTQKPGPPPSPLLKSPRGTRLLTTLSRLAPVPCRASQVSRASFAISRRARPASTTRRASATRRTTRFTTPRAADDSDVEPVVSYLSRDPSAFNPGEPFSDSLARASDPTDSLTSSRTRTRSCPRLTS